MWWALPTWPATHKSELITVFLGYTIPWHSLRPPALEALRLSSYIFSLHASGETLLLGKNHLPLYKQEMPLTLSASLAVAGPTHVKAPSVSRTLPDHKPDTGGRRRWGLCRLACL